MIGVWSLTGHADYLVHVFCTNLKQLNHLVHEVLLSHSAVSKVESKIVMEQIGLTAAYRSRRPVVRSRPGLDQGETCL